jgi:hypothetical protein
MIHDTMKSFSDSNTPICSVTAGAPSSKNIHTEEQPDLFNWAEMSDGSPIKWA